jgi:hypothetical protein
LGVVGAFGQITFDVTRRKRLPLKRGKSRADSSAVAGSSLSG